MSQPTATKAVRIAAEVRRRIANQHWRQGDRIPDEADLAIEFGAARATVNKALQQLAHEGLLERRRRFGTRVAVNPALRAVLTIPIVREQIEQAGMSYRHRLIAKRYSPAPEEIAQPLGLEPGVRLIHLRALHYGDDAPFQLEDRWINPPAVPEIENVDLHQINANEWLVRNAPYTHTELSFTAVNADRRDARLLQTRQGQALLIQHRRTWNAMGPITSVRLACHPGYELNTGMLR